jgi:hypothetical protein
MGSPAAAEWPVTVPPALTVYLTIDTFIADYQALGRQGGEDAADLDGLAGLAGDPVEQERRYRKERLAAAFRLHIS